MTTNNHNDHNNHVDLSERLTACGNTCPPDRETLTTFDHMLFCNGSCGITSSERERTDQHVTTGPRDLQPVNRRHRQQDVHVRKGWIDQRNLDDFFGSPVQGPASQEELAQSSSHVTQGSDQFYTAAGNLVDYSSDYPTVIANSRLDSTLPLSDYGVGNAIDVVPDGFVWFAPYALRDGLSAIGSQDITTGSNQWLPSTTPGMLNGLDVLGATNLQGTMASCNQWSPSPATSMLDNSTYFTSQAPRDSQMVIDPQVTSFNQWHPSAATSMLDESTYFASYAPLDDSTAINAQKTSTRFDQTGTDKISARELPTTHATGTFTAPLAALPIPKLETPRLHSVNTKAHTCDYAGCGKAFTRLRDLTRHGNLHGDPQYRCIVGCDRHTRGFFRPEHLRKHQRAIHGMDV